MCILGTVEMEEDKATLFRLGPQGEVPNYMREMGTHCCYGDVAQFVKCLLCKHEDPSLSPATHIIKAGHRSHGVPLYW